MKALILAAVTLLTGCALAPTSVPIELTHVSHLTQHFDHLKTDFGYDSLNVGVKWTTAPGLSIKLEEGIGLDSESHFNTRYYGSQPAFGALLGPREVFTGSIAYEIPLR